MLEKFGELFFDIWNDISKYKGLYAIGAAVFLLNIYFILPIEPIFKLFQQEDSYEHWNSLICAIILFVDAIYLMFFSYVHLKEYSNKN